MRTRAKDRDHRGERPLAHPRLAVVSRRIDLDLTSSAFTDAPERPVVVTTGLAPADRVAVLRAAFAATMKDPEFLAEAQQLGFEVDPVLGEKMQKIVEKVLATPKDVAAKAKGLLE